MGAHQDSDQRAIRVFVSSTFRDMQDERDELVKRVFPELRRKCEERGVAWSEVDLRWGVTDEAKAEDRVLPICLREIELSRPYFIGMLGQRYGWVPDELPKSLAEQYGWIDDDPGRSVTEMEILHGVLNDPAMAGHAFFYLRDPQWASTLPADEQGTFVDTDPQAHERLERLRERIRTSGFPVSDYDRPRAIADLVARDLGALIDQLFPPDENPDPAEVEDAGHRRFAATVTAGTTPREELSNAIDTAVRSGAVLVRGAAGSGKSALLAQWAAAHNTPVHFVGAAGSTWQDLTRRVIRLLDPAEKPADTDDELAQQFAAALATQRATVVLDGLDHLDLDDKLPLFWLPDTHGVVVSAGPGPHLDELTRRGWPAVDVTGLSADERRVAIPDYLSLWAKALDVVHVERLATAAQTANPLFLRIVLDELRQWGDHFTLGERIEHYLGAPDLDHLLDRVLERLEADFDRDRPDLTKDALSLVWAGHRGVTEAELRDALATTQAQWAPLFLAVEALLADDSGRLRPANTSFKNAIERRYQPGPQTHGRLADLLRTSVTPRAIEEVSHQLAAAERWDDLAGWVSRPDVFDLTYRLSLPALLRFWSRLEHHGHDASEAYRAVPPELSFQVAVLLAALGHLHEAITAATTAFANTEKRSTRIGLLTNRGAWQLQVNDIDGAETSYRQARQLAVEEGRRDLEQFSVNGLATVARSRGDRASATQLYREMGAIATERGDVEGQEMAAANQGAVLLDAQDWNGALDRYNEAESLARKIGDPAMLGKVLDAQGVVLSGLQRHAEAAAKHTEAVEKARESGNKYWLTTALGNLAAAYLALGDLGRAAAAITESGDIATAIGDANGAARSLLVKRTIGQTLQNEAVAAFTRGDFAAALTLTEQQLFFSQQAGDGMAVLQGTANRGELLCRLGRVAEGLPHLQQAETWARQNGLIDIATQVAQIAATYRTGR